MTTTRQKVIVTIAGMIMLLAIPVMSHAAVRAADLRPEFYKKWLGIPTETLLLMGKDYAEARNMPDSAALAFTIVANRYGSHESGTSPVQAVTAYNGLWQTYMLYFYDFAKANEFLINANEICDVEGLDKSMVLINYGSMYQTLADQTNDSSLQRKSLEYLHQAFAEASKGGSKDIMLVSFVNMAELASQLGGLGTLDAEWQQMQQMDGQQYPLYRYAVLDYKGLKAMKTGSTDEAIGYFEQQRRIFADTIPFFVRYNALSVQHLAEACLAGGRMAQALGWLKKMEQIGVDNDLKDLELTSYKMLADYNNMLGDGNATNTYLYKYLLLKDTLLNHPSTARLMYSTTHLQSTATRH